MVAMGQLGFLYGSFMGHTDRSYRSLSSILSEELNSRHYKSSVVINSVAASTTAAAWSRRTVRPSTSSSAGLL